ncbi:CHY zinc finger protein [Flaviaesturariibacter terrae]
MPAPDIKGFPIDDETRCEHYHSPLDIIALKFRCCGEWYPCIHCHEEAAGHAVQRWPESEWHTKAILCGACKTELTIHAYFASGYKCPHCASAFNPRCHNHDHLYFDVEPGERKNTD